MRKSNVRKRTTRHRQRTIAAWIVTSTPARRWTLAIFVLFGMVASAWILSTWPTRFRAEASFSTGTSAMLDASIQPELIESTLASMGPMAHDQFNAHADAVRLARRDERLVVSAEAAMPALAQQWALALADHLRRDLISSAPATSADVRRAQSRYAAAQRDFRSALARLGDHHSQSDDPWVDPASFRSGASEAEPTLLTVPALATAERGPAESLVESTMRELAQRRERLARAYTDEHPAVIALDRQMRHLRDRSVETRAERSRAMASRLREVDDDLRQASAEALTESLEVLEKERDDAKAELERIQASVGPTVLDPSSLGAVELGPASPRYVGLDRRGAFIAVLALLGAFAFGIDLLCRRYFSRSQAV